MFCISLSFLAPSFSLLRLNKLADERYENRQQIKGEIASHTVISRKKSIVTDAVSGRFRNVNVNFF